MTPRFQGWLDDVPFQTLGIQKGVQFEGLRACVSLIWSRVSLRYFWVPLRYVIKGAASRNEWDRCVWSSGECLASFEKPDMTLNRLRNRFGKDSSQNPLPDKEWNLGS